ncbi:MAG: LTA synthase family protein [Prevotella sp.]|nr:LTA synthase family protein [Prevotella sp.]
MKTRLLSLLRLYVYWLVVFVLQKPLFMAWYAGMYRGRGPLDWLSVAWHGLPLDFSLAGYLTIVPTLLMVISVWTRHRLLDTLMRVWMALGALLVVLAFLVNLGLYEYWGFPLDSTPLFYFLSSPREAFASVSVWYVVLAAVAWVALSTLVYLGAQWAVGTHWLHRVGSRRIVTTLVLLLALCVLVIPIRGGITVSTMNTGKAYFSDDQRLNHAAVNPLFSVMESLSHQEDFGSQYRFFEPAKANRLFAELSRKGSGKTTKLLKTNRPDIYIVILESFSSKLMASLGGEKDVAENLDRFGQEGVLFTHFYANSFRTDRGLVSILSGFPAQPTTSLMKYPRKTAHLPSITSELRKVGYGAKYYYGGDADFTNMRSYLVSQGFNEIISDVDFPVSDRFSKWGVPDHLVFERLLADLRADHSNKPMLRVIQTSSSHEPFDVPYQRLQDERLNAFAYTDDCVGRLVDSLRQMPNWEKSLVILVPDHLGCYPRNISNLVPEHYEIPLIMVGGAVAEPRRVDVIGSQHDLAATLLAQLGIDHQQFTFSKDMLDETAPHFAFFTVPDAFGFVTTENRIIFDNKAERVVWDDGGKNVNLEKGKAYLQKLYDQINELR